MNAAIERRFGAISYLVQATGFIGSRKRLWDKWLGAGSQTVFRGAPEEMNRL